MQKLQENMAFDQQCGFVHHKRTTEGTLPLSQKRDRPLEGGVCVKHCLLANTRQKLEGERK